MSCNTTSVTTCPQPSGLVAIQNRPLLIANISGLNVVCPPGHYSTANGGTAANGTCKALSYPKLENDIFWQNSSYFVGVGAAVQSQYQQNIVTLYNAFTGTLPASQTVTGQCVAGASYWDIGIRGDLAPNSFGTIVNGHAVTLNPTYSVLTDTSSYGGQHNSNANPAFISQYCDGSRTPPEFGGTGFAVPPGISDATVPNPIFNLTPVATVDEGNNWVNLQWGPLSMTNPTVVGADGNYGGGSPLGNYGLTNASPINGMVSCGTQNYNDAPAFDFYGNVRKSAACHGVEPGAVELSTTVASGPEIISLDPNTTPIGTTDLVVNLSGSGFTGVTGVSFGGLGSGIRVNNFSIVNDSSINVNISVPRTVTPGNYNVAFTGMPAGEGIPFTVTNATVAFSNNLFNGLTTAPANTSTKTVMVTVTNTGAGTFPGPFVLTAPPAVVKNGFGGAGRFSVIGGTCAVGSQIEVGQSCTVEVQYAPNGSVGVETAHITLTGEGFSSAGGGFGGEGTVTSGTMDAN